MQKSFNKNYEAIEFDSYLKAEFNASTVSAR
jgi:hypothetical protein